MWAKRAGSAFAALEAARSEAEAFDALLDYARIVGADLVSYHHVAPAYAARAENFSLLASGFPSDWVDHYQRNKLHRIDPIVAYTAYRTRPVLWSEVPARSRLTPEQSEYMTALYDWLAPGDGLAVPAFGPSGRHGYFGVGWREPLARWSGAQIRTLQAICESFHLRYCELRLESLDKDFELTEREFKIVEGMVRGWADAMIGATVGLRPDALRSALQRVLVKMGVTDRPSAVLRARALGLVADRAED